MKILLFCVLIFLSNNSYSQEDENDIFDSNRVDSVDLLEKEYSNSKVLFIGFPSHHTHQHIELLSKLLERIASDPNLKYIVLERAGDISKFYELLSTNELNTTLESFSFNSPEALKRSLCEGEWAYTIDQFFPKLRSINNKARPKNAPIIVKSIDGMVSTIKEDWPGKKPISDGTCNVSELRRPSFYVTSSNRESDTANNFSNRIWKKLGKNEKAIVLYNNMHLLSSFYACTPYMQSENVWEARISPLSWREFFLKQHPEAKKSTSLILIDEDAQFPYREYIFNFTDRHATRFPDQEWALPLRPFSNVLNEIGSEIFTIDSNARSYNASSDLTLPEIAQGFIFHPLANVLYRNLTGEEYVSTKPFCK
jgi:hypothetical protein